MSFSPNKSELTHFHRKRTASREQLKLDTQIVSPKAEVRFLEV